MPGCGGGGCCTCEPSYRDKTIEVEVYVSDIFSAKQMIEHWDAGVEAGESMLWDALGVSMGQVASDVMNEYGKSLNATEKIIQQSLDAQFDVLKQDKQAILAAAETLNSTVQTQAEDLSQLQTDSLE
jgi:hypothetical protein